MEHPLDDSNVMNDTPLTTSAEALEAIRIGLYEVGTGFGAPTDQRDDYTLVQRAIATFLAKNVPGENWLRNPNVTPKDFIDAVEDSLDDIQMFLDNCYAWAGQMADRCVN